ncbi:MAG: AAA family ATPase [Parvularculaceae bacterium]|nr:AAA family ATPase [Parvularculaceae bacterium]
MQTSRARSNPNSRTSARPRPSAEPSEAFPEGYQNDPDVDQVVQILLRSRSPTFILGKAGTGKSTLLRYLASLPQFRNHALLAPTGMAALKISGQTIHSFFRLPPRLLDRAAIETQRPNRAWKHLDTIFIDEISMVRADVLDAIDLILKRERSSTRPFGGVRMVMFGDFFQLPPVANESDRQILGEMGYTSPFSFHSHVLSGGAAQTYELTRVHRQSEHDFIEMLNGLRVLESAPDAVGRLNEKCHREHRAGVEPILLTGSNSRARTLNNQAMHRLRAEEREYRATVAGQLDFRAGSELVPEVLKLKVGARVIAMKNDPSRQWVNGALGTVVKLLPDSALVRFDNSQSITEVRRTSWTKTKYIWDDATRSIRCEVIGSYTQIPLNLASAITIHKAQGLSLDDVRIDLSDGAFASGQVYVALSRARTLSGLSFSAPIAESDVFFDHHVRNFYRSIGAVTADLPTVKAQQAKGIKEVMEGVMIQYLIALRNRDDRLIARIDAALAQRGLEIVRTANGIEWRVYNKK